MANVLTLDGLRGGRKGRKNWERICRLGPKTQAEREHCEDARFGAVDSYAAGGPPPVGTPFDFQKVEGKMGTKRSQLFTWTTKVHSPSWSVPAVGTCPAVCGIDKPRDLRDPSKIPMKCVGCYAFNSGKYGTTGVQQAMHRRWGWFDSEPTEDVVVDRLVEAIKVSGREVCKHKSVTAKQPWALKTSEKGKRTWAREDHVDCTKNIHGTPTLFRIFDSGDFHNARAVRIWRKVAERMKHTRFWAPTTAWVKYGVSSETEMGRELASLAKLKNVALKPSGLLLDKPAVHVKVDSVVAQGTTVVSWESERREVPCPWAPGTKKTTEKCTRSFKTLPFATTMSGKPVAFDPDDDTTRPDRIKIGGVPHYLCKGDCAKCQRCWEKDSKVAYVQHGPSVQDRDRLLRRTKEMLDYMDLLFPQYKDVGPHGSGAVHPAARFLTSPKFLRSLKAEATKRAANKAAKGRSR